LDLPIDELTELDDLREVADLFADVWGRSGEPPISSDILRALAHSGNYIAGARSAGRLIGGIVGWLGGHPPHDLHMHSHILGVLPGTEARGLGFALKQHQRTWCLERGVGAVEWTFDPLVRRNAYFNLTKLGAEAASYLVDFYGRMDDGINAGDESDRILIRWELTSERARAAAAGQPLEERIDESAARVLVVAEDGEPLAHKVSGQMALVQVPDDIVAMRRLQPEVARRWRQAVRSALGDAMSAGYRVTGATREGWYVLQADRG
jgi:predicted GNAT superfamily acetyltransferase